MEKPSPTNAHGNVCRRAILEKHLIALQGHFTTQQRGIWPKALLLREPTHIWLQRLIMFRRFLKTWSMLIITSFALLSLGLKGCLLPGWWIGLLYNAMKLVVFSCPFFYFRDFHFTTNDKAPGCERAGWKWSKAACPDHRGNPALEVAFREAISPVNTPLRFVFWSKWHRPQF